MTTLLITGASGFLGAHVVAGAIARGHAARAAVRASSDQRRLDRLAMGTDIVDLDLADRDPVALMSALTGVDAVIHCAAYGVDYRQSDFETALALNVAASVRLAEAATMVGCRFIHVGTSYEYGTEEGTLTEDRRLAPTGIYGVTKAAASLALQDLAHRTGTPIAIVRPFSMYGPLEGDHKFVPMVMSASREGRTVELTLGEQKRDYLYVGDVVKACLDLVVTDPFPSGEVFNICSGKGIGLRALAEAAVMAAGGDMAVLRWGAKPYRPAESMNVVGDPAKITAAIGWHATTPLADGMAYTAAAGSL
ncbi:NAD-dependent epimerase/dehydratase family protein [Sphingomonas sanguinis]|uniref:NAD-dependent epimerase/dehydratase family protein n=1 Tax=Sphingomonas sanguinis TaxID=33051 RepID=A0ABU5LTG9_9SPHN|nr:NAD-dependent epimerase/dehydratase family protein [Sphingomonas sanguinis]MDZ7283016.1 NAD-dependent epimerase/dehydratase family protein [Sphingomonas sanguinis]